LLDTRNFDEFDDAELAPPPTAPLAGAALQEAVESEMWLWVGAGSGSGAPAGGGGGGACYVQQQQQPAAGVGGIKR
jgi:hypothetical protein